ncbi:MAG: PQQ-binding-like beta-propeller repeat protein [Sandaracinus sp.]|nr:PQQ-binding-like beta-propeller repeat protein [Sandaracinus sp.]MCB9633888.1 PQQ-binding-like beta-propeller repeat protein [Sandaracinus sp.]
MRRLSLLLLFALACGDDDSPPPGDGGLPSDGAVDAGVDLDGGTDAGPPDEAPPEVSLHFPSRVSQVAAADVLVRGSATDPSGVTSVRVNDVAATSDDGFVTFEARVPVASGANTLAIRATDTLGNVSEPLTFTVERMVPLGTLFSLDVDPSGVVYGVDHRRDEVVRIVLDPLQVQVVSSSTDGQPNPMGGALGLAYDARRARILVANRRPAQILAIDPTTGARTVWADGTVSDSSTALRLPSRITIDPEGDRAFLLETDMAGADGRLLAIDLETATITTVRSDAVSPNPPIAGATAMDFDLASGRVMVMNRNVDQLFAVDPTDGSTRLVSDNLSPTSGDVLPFANTVSLRIDPTRGVAYLHEIEQRELLAVDLTTGARTRLGGDLALGDARLADTRDLVVLGDRLVFFETIDPSIVEVSLATGDRSFLFDRSFPRGERALGDATDLAFDARRERLFVGDHQALTALDLTTGERRRVLEDLDYVAGVAMDDVRDRVLVFDADAGLIALDPEDDSSTVLSPAGTEGAFGNVARVFVDVERDRYLVQSYATLFAVDPSSGERTEIPSEPNLLDILGDVAFDVARDRMVAVGRVDRLVGATPTMGLVGIDVTTGTQTLLADANSDPTFAVSWGLGIVGDVLWAGGYLDDERTSAIVRTDLVTEAQTVEAYPADGLASGNLGHSIAARASDGSERFYLVLYTPGRVELHQVDPATGERVVIAR